MTLFLQFATEEQIIIIIIIQSPVLIAELTFLHQIQRDENKTCVPSSQF